MATLREARAQVEWAVLETLRGRHPEGSDGTAKNWPTPFLTAMGIAYYLRESDRWHLELVPSADRRRSDLLAREPYIGVLYGTSEGAFFRKGEPRWATVRISDAADRLVRRGLAFRADKARRRRGGTTRKMWTAFAGNAADARDLQLIDRHFPGRLEILGKRDNDFYFSHLLRAQQEEQRHELGLSAIADRVTWHPNRAAWKAARRFTGGRAVRALVPVRELPATGHLPRAVNLPALEASLQDPVRSSTVPPLALVKQYDGRYWIADGNHRLAAARRLGFTDVPAWVTHG